MKHKKEYSSGQCLAFALGVCLLTGLAGWGITSLFEKDVPVKVVEKPGQPHVVTAAERARGLMSEGAFEHYANHYKLILEEVEAAAKIGDNDILYRFQGFVKDDLMESVKINLEHEGFKVSIDIYEDQNVAFIRVNW
jgi:hypothetical protein